MAFSSKFLDDFDDNTCGICIDDTTQSNIITACGHRFHLDCFSAWTQPTCPACRQISKPIRKIISKPTITFKGLQLHVPIDLSKVITHKSRELKFVGNLMNFQEQAVKWMISVADNKGILAFDMGMGKTVISIAYLMTIKFNAAIIVLPIALMDQWYASLLKFTDLTPDDIFIYHGSNIPVFPYDHCPYRIMITNVESINKHPEINQTIIDKFDTMIVDEAHNLRNMNTTKYRNIRLISMRMKHRFLLSGTPIHNSITDFIALATLAAGTNIFGHELADWKSNHYYRLMKSDTDLVTQLPPKIINNIKLTMPIDSVHRQIYDEIHAETRAYIRKDGSVHTGRFGVILAKITRLLQSCNHPDNNLGEEESIPTNILGVSLVPEKFSHIIETIRTIPNNEKIVIFSRWNSSLKSLTDQIVHSFPTLKESIVKYNGSMSREQKDAAVTSFRTQPNSRIFMANILAGGCGLNLIEANHLIILEPNWTSAIENQAIDRIHRIGQQKQVNIYLYHIANTIEEWIHTLKEEKRALADHFDKDEEYKMPTSLIREILSRFTRVQ